MNLLFYSLSIYLFKKIKTKKNLSISNKNLYYENYSKKSMLINSHLKNSYEKTYNIQLLFLHKKNIQKTKETKESYIFLS